MEKVRAARLAGRAISVPASVGSLMKAKVSVPEKLPKIPEGSVPESISLVEESPIKKRKVPEVPDLCSSDPVLSEEAIQEGARFADFYKGTLGKSSERFGGRDLVMQSVSTIHEVKVLLSGFCIFCFCFRFRFRFCVCFCVCDFFLSHRLWRVRLCRLIRLRPWRLSCRRRRLP